MLNRSYSLLLVGRITGIESKKNGQGQVLQYISVESLEYMVGFEEEGMTLKNYISK